MERWIPKIIDEEKRKVWVGEAEDLWSALSPFSPSWDAFCRHIGIWAQRDVPPSQTPIAQALPLLRIGESVMGIAKRLAPRFNMTPSGLRGQLRRILSSSSPPPTVMVRGNRLGEVRRALSLSHFTMGKLSLSLTKAGLRVGVMDGPVIDVGDDEVKELVRWLVGLWGVPKEGSR